jgi:hypothetical protein
MDAKINPISGSNIVPNVPNESPLSRLDSFESDRETRVKLNDEKCQQLWTEVKKRFDKCLEELVHKERDKS